VPQIGTENSS